MKRFNIGVEVIDTAGMRGLALQCYLAQGHNADDFFAAETVLWTDQPEALADSDC